MLKVNHEALARLARYQSGELPPPPMWETVPLRLLSFAPGRIEMQARADERHINAIGSVHGGFAATVLDTVLGLAIYTSLGEASRHITVDLAVKLVKAIPLATPLIAASELVHISRSVGVSQAVLRSAEGVIYAHGTTTCMIQRGVTSTVTP
ncbi:MAG: PaaI family thioesterase [Proteobacteria bacterium]|nr:PaaI family thioesterase [Pseudomonadota bacterium]